MSQSPVGFSTEPVCLRYFVLAREILQRVRLPYGVGSRFCQHAYDGNSLFQRRLPTPSFGAHRRTERHIKSIIIGFTLRLLAKFGGEQKILGNSI